MIEMLISLYLLSFIFLAIDAMGIITLREMRTSYYFASAVAQIENMAEQLQAAKNNDMSQQIAYWNQQNQKLLPKGRGVVNGVYPKYVIAIFWGSIASITCNKNQISESGCLQLSLSL